MKWPVPLLVAYLLLALEGVVRDYVRIGAVSPSLIFPFVVFVALLASSNAAMWTALLVGAAVDITTLRATTGVPIVIVGPHALGYAAAAYMILTLRPMVMRRNVVTMVALSVIGSWLAAVVIVSVLAIRRTLFHGSWADGLPGSLLPDLWQRLLDGCYTGAAALVLAAILLPLAPWFGFQDPSIRRPFSRRY